MDLAENALFKSYGIICLPSASLPSTVPDELSMNRSDSNGFFFLDKECVCLAIAPIKTTDTLVAFMK